MKHSHCPQSFSNRCCGILRSHYPKQWWFCGGLFFRCMEWRKCAFYKGFEHLYTKRVNGRYLRGFDTCGYLYSFILLLLHSLRGTSCLKTSLNESEPPKIRRKETGEAKNEEAAASSGETMGDRKSSGVGWEGRGSGGKEVTDTECVWGREFTRGVKKKHHLAKKKKIQKFAIWEAGVGKQDTKEYSQCCGIK